MTEPPVESTHVALPPLARAHAAAALTPPAVPALVAERVRLALRAAASRVPILLVAPGALHLRIARALHAEAGLTGPLLVATGPAPDLGRFPPDATVIVDLGTIAPHAQSSLAAMLDDASVWVVAVARPDDDIPAALRGRLAAVALEVPPLFARPADIAPLAAAILRERAERAGRPAPALTDAAFACLAAAPWRGDVVELESVLTRAFLLADGDTIDAAHLALDPPPAVPMATRAPAPDDDAPDDLEDDHANEHAAHVALVVGELAHDIRNPFVPLKTFVDNLDEVLRDPALHARFGTLVREAIDRMDGPLSNVLAFTRLGAPRPADLDFGGLVDRVLADLAAEGVLAPTRVRRANSDQGHCASDPEYLEYGLRNLLTGITREVPDDEPIRVDTSTNGIVSLRITAGPRAADRLRVLVAPARWAALDDPTLLPLVFTLARAALSRIGGQVRVVPEPGGAAAIVLRLPARIPDKE